MEYFLPFLGMVIVALIGFFSGGWAYRKNKADAAGTIVKSALDLVQQYEASLKTYNDRLEAAEARAVAAENRVEQLEEKVAALEAQIIGLDQTPVTKKNLKKEK